MRKLFAQLAILIAVLITGSLLSTRSEAAPSMSQAGMSLAIEQLGDDLLQPVADGCGRGWYRDRYGRCRTGGRGGAVVIAPGVITPLYVAPRRTCVRRCGPYPYGCRTVCR